MHKILVVDDELVACRVAELILNKAGFPVTIAHDGFSALERADEDEFDLILSDYLMPEMNGLELCQKLRQHNRYRETPFVLLSSKTFDQQLMLQPEELGIAAVYSKPFSPAKLVKTVEELVGAAV